MGNYYSYGTLERLTVNYGMLILAGDLSHSRSVSRSVRQLIFYDYVSI